MSEEKRYVLTGAPGSGKSALLDHLRILGFRVVAEPARQILAQQRAIDGEGIPSRNPRRFVDLLLSRAISEYQRLEFPAAPVFFDRGIPDTMGYAAIFGLDHPPAQEAAMKYPYNRRVFFAPSWEEIYACDDERTVSFEGAREFGDVLRTIYGQLGYVLIDLPCVSVEQRAQFILDQL